MSVEYPFLFNFAASYSEGGYKRLHEYARWFSSHGGAWFVIHPRCEHLRAEFPGNLYFIISQPHFKRLYDDSSYLDALAAVTGQPLLYYAYGIPLYRCFGRINWFHLQNALTLGTHRVPLSIFHRLKFRLLGYRFRRGFALADVIAAESEYSLGLFEIPRAERKFHAPNGNDDELARLREPAQPAAEQIATAVGTFSYKALGESFRIFQALSERQPGLRMVIVGDPKPVPAWLRRHPQVTLEGRLDRGAVVDILRRSRFYISATYVENSYNGAAEGAFLAEESYISDIPAHRELLRGEAYEHTRFAGLERSFFHLRRQQLTGHSLKSWDALITQMIARVRQEQRSGAEIIPLHPSDARQPAALDHRPRRQVPR